ncbi:FxsA family protein [Stappia taiwanensis]|uniref:FxsA family protein n=1 Tax=Stappia taiwanensis TaxID=992267 RepID=A0A838XS69_9HYPH|nr:FxsA family protein [Stappia taiwanensis]MBA4611911.1 FxsA family protein [Stappia taiwanensis]GGF03745.1 membrane protein [Stappia taiwanensis]
MPIGLILLLVLIGLPLIEIAVFVEVGSEIGAVWTILLTIATAVAGSVMLRLQGVSLLTRMRAEMDAGRVPGEDLVQGAMMVVASILLLIPGFVTDAIGLLLFVPPLRAALARVVARNAPVTVVHADVRRQRGEGVVDLDADDWSSVDPNDGQRPTNGQSGSPWITDERPHGDDNRSGQ